jgi:CO/xanthine dehydrogenase FAD-binding subunit
MKPAAFDYTCPDSVEEAMALLANHADAKVIAGGQSLIPMLNFRVVRPAMLVDIGRLLELDFIKETDSGLRVGALTRHCTLETSPLIARMFPVIGAAMKHVAHVAIRNRGTFGGSLSHADPAAELPMLAVLLDATMTARSLAGERVIEARDFFVGSLTCALEEDEILLHVDLPGLLPQTGWAFEEFARRPGDFALASVAVLLERRGEQVMNPRIAMMGVGETPLRIAAAEDVLRDQPWSDTLVTTAVRAGCEPLQPNLDLHASAAYRRHLAAELLARALHDAWRRASGELS